jgi:tetratricopeptide (TPR) repeat protein
MTLDSNATASGMAPSETSPALPVGGWTAPRRGRLRLVLPAILVGAAAFNGWWFWRENRPVPDLATVSRWARAGRHEEARAVVEERLRRSPRDGAARMELARLLASRGDLLGCALQLRLVPQWWPQKPEALLREGQALMQADRAKDAEAAWKAVIKDDPLHPAPADVFHDAAQELLGLYAIEDRWDDAHVVLWRAYDEASPADHPALLAMRIRSEVERVAPMETSKRLRRFVAADPADGEALRALARADSMLGLRSEALQHISACLKLRPDNPRAWRDYLTLLYEEGDFKALRKAMAGLPAAAEAEPEVWNLRGLLREKDSDWAGAAQAYREALRLNPYSVAYLHRLGMAEGRLGRQANAVDCRKRAQQVRAAREQLTDALTDYLESGDPRKPGAPSPADASRRLARLCATLGWSRAAEGWSRVSSPP